MHFPPSRDLSFEVEKFKKHLLKGKDQGGDWLKKAIRQTRISHLLQKHAIIPEHSGIQKINQRQPININIVFQIEEQ